MSMKPLMWMMLLMIPILSGVCFGAMTDYGEAYYSFDNSSNASVLIYDVAGNYNATKKAVTEPSSTTNGLIGNATDYDGTDDYVVSTGNSIIPRGEQSISFWIKTTDTTGESYVLGNNPFSLGLDGTCIRLDAGSNQLDVNLAYNGIREGLNYTTIDVTDGAWHHIVLVWDGTDNDALIYHNGVYASGVDMSTAGSTDASIDDFTLGIASSDLSSGALEGQLDEVFVLNATLSAGDVAELYNSGNGYNPYVAVSVDINSPANNTHSPSILSVNFTATSTGLGNPDCELYVADSLVASQTGIPSGSSPVLSYPNATSNTNHSFYVYCESGGMNDTTGVYYYFREFNATAMGDYFTPTQTCPLETTDLATAFVYFMVVIVLFLLVAVNEMWIKIPAFNIFTGLGFLSVALSLNNCGYFIQLPFLMFCFGLWWYVIVQ